MTDLERLVKLLQQQELREKTDALDGILELFPAHPAAHTALQQLQLEHRAAGTLQSVLGLVPEDMRVRLAMALLAPERPK